MVRKVEYEPALLDARNGGLSLSAPPEGLLPSFKHSKQGTSPRRTTVWGLRPPKELTDPARSLGYEVAEIQTRRLVDRPERAVKSVW
jgi:hypothetical protein